MNYQNIVYPYQKLISPFDIEILNEELKKLKINIITKLPNKLKQQNIKVDKYNKKYKIICENYMKNLPINSLTDYFTEKQRIQCSFGNKKSPLETWNNQKTNIIAKCYKKYKKVNIHLLRETILDFTKPCNNFRITVVLALLKIFKPKRVLDGSAGWGDRLLGAILSQHVNYYESCDPNIDLHSGYDEIKEIFVKKSKMNYVIHPTGFLECNLGERTFDCVLTSPPFFTLEKYSTHDNDSITKFNNNKDWVHKFIVPMMEKFQKHLIIGGHLLLYIHDYDPILNDALKKVNSKMKFLGSIYFYDTVPRKIQVWKKIKNN